MKPNQSTSNTHTNTDQEPPKEKTQFMIDSGELLTLLDKELGSLHREADEAFAAGNLELSTRLMARGNGVLKATTIVTQMMVEILNKKATDYNEVR